jgi:hypothetical protein
MRRTRAMRRYSRITPARACCKLHGYFRPTDTPCPTWIGVPNACAISTMSVFLRELELEHRAEVALENLAVQRLEQLPGIRRSHRHHFGENVELGAAGLGQRMGFRQRSMAAITFNWSRLTDRHWQNATPPRGGGRYPRQNTVRTLQFEWKLPGSATF